MFQATKAWTMEKYNDNHYFCLWHGEFTMVSTFGVAFYGVFFHLGIKNFAEVIRNTENFSNYVLGDYNDYGF